MTPDAAPPATLRYDSACPFCAASARFIEARTRGQLILEAAPGIAAAEFVAGGVHCRGGAAITAALARHPRWRWVRILDAPGIRLGRDAAYALVARGRWLLSRASR